jgi:hypothetical protein
MSGVEFPYLLYRIAKDGDVEPVLEYKKDRALESRWLWGDLSTIPTFLQNREFNQVLATLTSQAPLDIWNLNDLPPFFILPIYYLVQLLRTGTMQPLIEKY